MKHKGLHQNSQVEASNQFAGIARKKGTLRRYVDSSNLQKIRKPQANNVILEDKFDDKLKYYSKFGGDNDNMPKEGNIIQAYHVIAEELKIDYDIWYLDIGATHHLTYR